MHKTFLLFLFLIASAFVYSQNVEGNSPKKKKEKPSVTLYKIFSTKRDTTFVDTSLSIQKEYKFNYLRRDIFELQEFANVGQTYNKLAYEFNKTNLLSLFAAQSHHYNYREIEGMEYFNVPTPLSELYFKTAFKQGQQLDAFFTINTSEQFNFSMEYMGVRSLGAYQNSLTSTGNFKFTTNYHTKNKRLHILAHVTAQDILNEENGGLTEESIILFQTNHSDFKDRGRLDVNFEDAENLLKGFRFFIDHDYQIIQKKDSISPTLLSVGNIISFEDKSYLYRQDKAYDGFGESYVNSGLNNKVKLEEFNIQGYAKFENNVIGNLYAYVGYTEYNYGYNSILNLDEQSITNRLKGDVLQTGATYKKRIGGFAIYGEGAINVSGDVDANFLMAGASYSINEKNSVSAEIKSHSVAPNYNFLLFQSDYKNYNWQNNFNNVKTQDLTVKLESNSILNLSVSYSGIDDYAYFTIKANDSTPTPNQYNERVDYVKVELQKEFRYKKFALENTLLFQEALSGEEILNVPQFITRNTLYFHDEWFKKALYAQTGITFKYYSNYNMNAYDPVLAEFYVQNDQELGGVPYFDIFFNAKVKQIRFYFKYENFGALFSSEKNYFAAPGYPYRDAVIRFGFVWNFFM